MDSDTEICIKDEAILQDTHFRDTGEKLPLESAPQGSKPNQFMEVLVNEAEYIELGDDPATVIELNSDVECISINSDSSQDIILELLHSPPKSPILLDLPELLEPTELVKPSQESSKLSRISESSRLAKPPRKRGLLEPLRPVGLLETPRPSEPLKPIELFETQRAPESLRPVALLKVTNLSEPLESPGLQKPSGTISRTPLAEQSKSVRTVEPSKLPKPQGSLESPNSLVELVKLRKPLKPAEPPESSSSPDLLEISELPESLRPSGLPEPLVLPRIPEQLQFLELPKSPALSELSRQSGLPRSNPESSKPVEQLGMLELMALPKISPAPLVLSEQPIVPEPLQLPQPPIIDVRTIDSWEFLATPESLDSPIVISEFPTNPLSSTEETDPLSITTNKTPMDFFNIFATHEMFTMIVGESNKFGMKLTRTRSPFSRMRNYREITIPEFKRFLGLLYHMGNVKLPRINDYWMMGRFFHIRVFGETMARNRFYQILKALHFNSNGNSKEDGQSKIRPLIDYFNDKMKPFYFMENETKSEEMALLRGKLLYYRYRKNRRHKCEIKMDMMTDPNGLVLSFSIPEKGDVIDKQGQEIEVDYVDLENERSNCTEALKRKHATNSNKDNQKKLKYDESDKGFSDDSEYDFKLEEDNEDILGFTIEFDEGLQPKRAEKSSNSSSKTHTSTSAIYLQDRMKTFYACERESMPSYIKIGIHILQLILLNSYTLFKKRTNSKLSFLNFRMRVIRELIEEVVPVHPIVKSIVYNNDSVHLPVNCPRSDKNRVLKRQCVQCKALRKKRIESIYMCPLCPGQPGLCLENCFRDYHNYV